MRSVLNKFVGRCIALWGVSGIKGNKIGVTAYKRIRQEASIFLPLYDPEVLIRYPSGISASR
jgi:hypothetical protein